MLKESYEERCFIEEPKTWPPEMQRVYEMDYFKPSDNVKNNLLLMDGGIKEEAKLCSAKVLLFSGRKLKKPKGMGSFCYLIRRIESTT